MLLKYQLKRMKQRFPSQFKEELNREGSKKKYLLIEYTLLYQINISKCSYNVYNLRYQNEKVEVLLDFQIFIWLDQLHTISKYHNLLKISFGSSLNWPKEMCFMCFSLNSRSIIRELTVSIIFFIILMIFSWFYTTFFVSILHLAIISSSQTCSRSYPSKLGKIKNINS